MVREGRVFISSGSKPDFGASYSIQVLEIGAQVASGSSGTTITVRAGHGFAAGDKVMRGTDATTFSATNVVASVTSTTVVMTTAYTVAAGDLLVNLAVDSSTSATPNFDGAGLTVYTTLDYTASAANNTMTADANGRYRYYHKGIARWELVRTGSTLISLYTDTEAPVSDRINVKDFGAVGDGSNDDYAAIQAAIDYAESFVSETYFALLVSGGSTVFFPRSTYKISAPITIDSPGIKLTGEGHLASIINPYNGTDGIRLGDQTHAAYHDAISVEGIGVCYAESVTVAAGTHGIKVWGVANATISDVRVAFPLSNTVANLVGISLTDSEQFHVSDVEVAYVQGTGSIAYLIDGNFINRGNMLFDRVTAVNCYIGLKTIKGGPLNNLNFNAFKVVLNNALMTVPPLYAIWLGGATLEGVTFNDTHIEGTTAPYQFDIGVYFDSSDPSTINSVLMNNTFLGGVDIGFKFDAVSDYIQWGITLNNTNFFGTLPVTTAFLVGQYVKDLWIMKAARQFGQTVTTWLTDNSTAGSGNLFVWNDGLLGGVADRQVWKYKQGMTLDNLTLITTGGASGLATIGGNATVAGTLGVTGATTLTGGVTGAMTATGNVTSGGHLRGLKATEALTSSAAITTAGRFLIDITNTSGANTPTLVAPSSVDGQLLILRIATITGGSVTFANTATQELAGDWTTPGVGDTLTLVASGVVWYELCRSNN